MCHLKYSQSISMKNIIIVSVIIFLAGCTKETYVEGLVPNAKSFDLNKTMPIINGQTTSCVIAVEGTNYQINFFFSRYKSTAANTFYGAAINDSLIITSITSNLQIETKNNTINKYTAGELTNTSTTFATTNIPLFAAIKKPPYTSGYTASSQSGSAILNFSINQDGYFAYKINNAILPIYGWGHITIDDKNIVFDRYGYQTFEVCKAGK